MMKTTKWIAGIALAATVAVGGASMASATEGATGSAATVGARCAKVPEVQEMIDRTQADLEARRTTLQGWRTEASETGRTKAVERLDKHIARLDTRLSKLAERETKLTTWSSSHCSAG